MAVSSRTDVTGKSALGGWLTERKCSLQIQNMLIFSVNTKQTVHRNPLIPLARNVGNNLSVFTADINIAAHRIPDHLSAAECKHSIFSSKKYSYMYPYIP
jgi:hypothetical protein